MATVWYSRTRPGRREAYVAEYTLPPSRLPNKPLPLSHPAKRLIERA